MNSCNTAFIRTSFCYFAESFTGDSYAWQNKCTTKLNKIWKKERNRTQFYLRTSSYCDYRVGFHSHKIRRWLHICDVSVQSGSIFCRHLQHKNVTITPYGTWFGTAQSIKGVCMNFFFKNTITLWISKLSRMWHVPTFKTTGNFSLSFVHTR